MTLNEILKEIKELQPLADENLELGAPETLTGRRGRKNSAIESLGRLKKAYSNELLRTASFILVIGDKREEFIKLASKGKKTLASDPELFFSELADRVPPQLYLGKESVSNLFDILGRHLEDKMISLDVVGYPQLVFRQEYQRTLRSREEFLSLVRQAITNQVGGEIVGIHTSRLLTETAINKRVSKMIPIFLPTADERFGLKVARDLGTLTNRTFVVAAGNISVTPAGVRVLKVEGEQLDGDNAQTVMASIQDEVNKLELV